MNVYWVSQLRSEVHKYGGMVTARDEDHAAELVDDDPWKLRHIQLVETSDTHDYTFNDGPEFTQLGIREVRN